MILPMEFLLNPNFAYIILVLGIISAVMAILIPGTGIPEVGTLIALSLAVYLTTQLGVNYVALVILLGGMIFLVLAMRKRKQRINMIVAVVLLLLGSIFLYPSNKWYVPAVNPILALVVSPLASVFMWLVGRKTLEAQLAPKAHDLQTLIGQLGESTTPIHETGTIQLSSELWSACSETYIPSGAQVRVIGRDGFTLIVEKV